MKIGVFTYTFPHLKTQNGLYNLQTHGYTPCIALAAPPVELSFYQSKQRISPKDIFLNFPQKICNSLNIPYEEVPHNSEKCLSLIHDRHLDLGIILGARILPSKIIDAFNLGIINLHPALLPGNRGLDNIKWSILKNEPIGVTAHFIDKYIDRGRIICQETIPIYKDDTLLDLFLRNQHLEQKLLISSLDKIKKGQKDFDLLGEGTYHKAVPHKIEIGLDKKFKSYKEKFGI